MTSFSWRTNYLEVHSYHRLWVSLQIPLVHSLYIHDVSDPPLTVQKFQSSGVSCSGHFLEGGEGEVPDGSRHQTACTQPGSLPDRSVWWGASGTSPRMWFKDVCPARMRRSVVTLIERKWEYNKARVIFLKMLLFMDLFLILMN